MALPLGVAQGLLLYLARGRARQLGELDRVGTHESGQALAGEGEQLLLRGVLPGDELDEGLGALAPFLVRGGDDGRRVDGGVGAKRLLDLDRRDVLATGDDDVLL